MAFPSHITHIHVRLLVPNISELNNFSPSSDDFGLLRLPRNPLFSSSFKRRFSCIFVTLFCLMGLFICKCSLTPLAPERLDHRSQGHIIQDNAAYGRTRCERKAGWNPKQNSGCVKTAKAAPSAPMPHTDAEHNLGTKPSST